jgi:hypothetical protein
MFLNNCMPIKQKSLFLYCESHFYTLLEKSMDIIEKGFHVGLLIVNKYFFFSIMSYLIKALLCVMRIILLLECDYVIRI